MLYKREQAAISPIDERIFDYLDSPNLEEHTHDRCRWQVALNRVTALEHEREVLQKRVEKMTEDYEAWITELKGPTPRELLGLVSKLEAQFKTARDALQEIADRKHGGNWSEAVAQKREIAQRALATFVSDRKGVA